MLRSQERILVTHTGSLPRPPSLTQLLAEHARRSPVDAEALRQEVNAATRDVVAKQLACGIDVGNNGEQFRESFFTYVQHRLTGFDDQSERPIMRDIIEYPTFAELQLRFLPQTSSWVNALTGPKAMGEVKHASSGLIQLECEELLRHHAEAPGRFSEVFMTSASPGIIGAALQNTHYPSDREYLFAVAEALRPEYRHIFSRELVLQVDCPDLAMERHTSFADRPLDEFLTHVDLAVDALNHALEGIPQDRVRMHVCWGHYEGPHDLDVPLDDILPHLYRAKVGALAISLANPRHEHEYKCFARHPLPPGWLLIAGAIDVTTNYVEHPEVVADRLERAAKAVGDPRRVLAGTDCGFDPMAGIGKVAEEVAWKKLEALRDGAALASKRLF